MTHGQQSRISGRRTTALMVFGGAAMTIVTLGNVVMGGQQSHEDERLFRKETFGGNGRTCETCHSRSTGTLSPADVRTLLLKSPSDPLFLHDGLDDGASGTSRIAEHATIRVVRPLPPNIRIAEAESPRHSTRRRWIRR